MLELEGLALRALIASEYVFGETANFGFDIAENRLR